MKPTILIKVGGSSITDKSTPETLNEGALHWLATQLTQQQYSFILVHGAGSFGHFTAKEYGLSGPTTPPPPPPSDDTTTPRQRLGLAHTRRSVQTLNQHVIRILVEEHQIPAVSLSPGLLVQAHGGPPEARETLVAMVQDTLRCGLLPVLHGDGALYGQSSVGILGGDVVTEILGTRLENLHSVVFLTDVAGVYTSDPNLDPTAQRIETIRVDDAGKISVEIAATESTHAHDVTGGLRGKLQSATNMARNVPVVITKCSTKSAELALQGGLGLPEATLLLGDDTA